SWPVFVAPAIDSPPARSRSGPAGRRAILSGRSLVEIAFVVALILLNGLFAMSEIALVTARRARLEKLAEDGDRSARVALGLADEPTRFLSTVQIGITAIGILNGILGEAALADPLAAMLRTLGVGAGA